MTTVGGILLAALLVIATSSPVNSQVVANWPVIATSGPTECGQAPPMCEGGSHIQNAPASFDAFVYISGEAYQVEECALGVTWPATWSVEAEICAGSIVEGTLDNLQDGIRVAFAPCVYGSTAFLHLRVEASSTGRIIAVPGTGGAFGWRSCGGGNFEPYWFEQSGYVDVGDVCGGFPMQYPCDACTIYGGLFGGEPSATFAPSSWQVTVPQGGKATISVYLESVGECQQIPECVGGPWGPYPCDDTLLPQPETEWLTVARVDAHYEARVDGANLPPGVYYGGAEVEGYGCCASVCWPVELTVVPPTTAIEEPPTSAATWGQIKALYR